jgi:hypothetical protein
MNRTVLFALVAVLCCAFVSCDKNGGGRSGDTYVPSGSIEKARKLYVDGKLDEADAELITLIEKSPENPFAHFYLGLTSFNRGNLDQSKLHFVKALELNPSSEFCEAIQEQFGLDNSRVIGSGKGFWLTPTLIDSDRAVLLAIIEDTDKDGDVSLADNAAVVHVQLASRRTAVMVDATTIKGPAHPSPDGKRLAYASPRKDTNKDGVVNGLDNSGIYLFDMESRAETQVVTDDFHCADPSFSQDGKGLYYVSVRIDSNNDGKVNFDDNFAIFRYDLITQETRKIVALPGDCRRPFATASDSALVFWGVNEDTNSDGRIDADDFGGVFRYDTVNPALEAVLKWSDAIGIYDFSVNGNKMVAVMDPDPGEGADRAAYADAEPDRYGYGLYTVDLITRKRKKVLTPVIEKLAQPTIASDGHTVAFQRFNDMQSTFVCYYYDTERPFLSAEELMTILRARE